MMFSERLTEILAARSMNKSDLSRALGVTPQAAGQWALGGHGPTVARLQKIAAALDVPAADLLMPPGSPISNRDSTPQGFALRELLDANATARGRRLHDLRKERKLIQAVVAEAVGVERSTLAGIERGATVGRETLVALANFFGTTIDYLERGTGAPGQDNMGELVEDEIERSILRLWRLLDQPKRDAVRSLMTVLVF